MSHDDPGTDSSRTTVRDMPVSPLDVHAPPPVEVIGPRRRLPFWDRIKFLLLFGGLWFFLVWSSMAENELVTFRDAWLERTQSSRWLIVVLAIELIRQIHIFIAERWGAYNRFWVDKVFGRLERYTQRRFSPWTRYRLGRAFRWLIVIAVLAVVLGQIYDVSPWVGLFKAPAALYAALPMLAQVVAILAIVILQFAALFWFLSKGGVDTYFPEDIKTRFDDVWGQDHVVERVKENIVFLENPEEIEKKGGYVPAGILLWGPPGTGKTLMAEAVAGETGKPYVFVDPGAFTNMFMGVGILKVKGLFRKLRKLALRYGGVIVFFDEADSLGNRGGSTGAVTGASVAGTSAPAPWDACHGFSFLTPQTQSTLFQAQMAPGVDPAGMGRHGFIMGGMNGGGAGMGTLQALLTELSGLKKPRGFVNRVVRRTLGMKPKPPPKYRMLVMMATNLPSALDEALLRPGRIDRIYRVGYPSKEGRKRTYEGYFDKVRHELTDAQIEHLATITPYATGATIKDLVNESLIVALRDDRDVITYRDVLRAKVLKSVGPPEGVEYIERERHAVAVHEACHAVVSYLVQRGNVIDTATIQKGQDFLGFVQPIPIEERFTSWRTEYEADVMVSLASLVGERMFFGGDNSSGVSGDLQNATRLALAMEGLWGMGETIGSYAVSRAPQGAMAVNDGTDRALLDGPMGVRVERLLTELSEKTQELLTEHRSAVLAVAHALETHKTISGEDVIAAIEGTEGPVVDGRSYVEMRGELEEYHSQALAAHEGREHQMTMPHARVADTPAPAPDTGAPQPAAPKASTED
jgi:cell division protease FtsH